MRSNFLYNFGVGYNCGWPGQALAALNKQDEACQVWHSGYESAIGLPEELPLVVQLHNLAMKTEKGDPDTESMSQPSSKVHNRYLFQAATFVSQLMGTGFNFQGIYFHLF